jgi:hypothetical protein
MIRDIKKNNITSEYLSAKYIFKNLFRCKYMRGVMSVIDVVAILRRDKIYESLDSKSSRNHLRVHLIR